MNGMGEYQRAMRRRSESLLLRAGASVAARTGCPPSLAALKAATGLAYQTVAGTRARLVAEGRWPWPVPGTGAAAARDRRGLTDRERRWLAAFRAQGGMVNLTRAAERLGTSQQRAHKAYHDLVARGHVLGPLARPARPLVPGEVRRDARGGRERRPPTPREIAARAAAIRAAWTPEDEVRRRSWAAPPPAVVPGAERAAHRWDHVEARAVG